jgi:hypothetical protein
MHKSLSKDINQTASSVVQKATEQAQPKRIVSTGYISGDAPPPSKNPAAVTLGRLGGLKGGKARAEKLSSERRKMIARNAAFKRWAAK